MADQPKINKKRKFDKRDFQHIAEYIVEERGRRKNAKVRQDLEKQWEEVDRQLKMEYDFRPRLDPQTGKFKQGTEWMSALELPLQAQTLEMLSADARRTMFAEQGPWYRAHVDLTDDWLENVQGLLDFGQGSAIEIAGGENDPPGESAQVMADRFCEALLNHIHRQYDFISHWDQVNAEAFSYGTGIGRTRKVTKTVFRDTSRGVVRDQRALPVFFPRSIKDTYLDDSEHNVMNEGQIIGPSVIWEKTQNLVDVVEAATKGSKDPNNENGGWMPSALKGLDGDKNNQVHMIEWEGDLIVPRKTTGDMFIPNAIVTVLMHEGEKRVVRFRFRDKPFSSYTIVPYHLEMQGSPYGTGPLMKGMPLQKSATAVFNRLIDASVLNTEPPVRYEHTDPFFAKHGGPKIEPRALWEAVTQVEPVQIGDPAVLLQVYLSLLRLYGDVTGMQSPRLGQQTLSHTTAFAKEAELTRGQVRTVDYAKSTLGGPATSLLYKEFEHLKDVWGAERRIWAKEYGGFLNVKRQAIPERASFEVFGAAGPAEKRAQISEQIQAIQLVASIDAIKVQNGLGAPMDYEAFQKFILKNTGFSDVDVFFTAPSQGQIGNSPPGQGVPSAIENNPGLTSTALQSITQGAVGR